MASKERQVTQSSLRQALHVLKLFSVDQPEWGVSQLAQQLDLAKSTVHRILSTLSHNGFVTKDSQTNKYRLSARLLHLGHAVLSQYPFHRHAQPILHKLVHQTGETAHLCVLHHTQMVCISKVEGKHPTPLKSYIGWTNPAFCTASGQAILAYHPEVVEQIIADGLKPYTSRSPATRAKLLIKLAKVRENGVAVSIGEWQDNIASVAAPVWDEADNKVIASINIVGPIQRIVPDKIPVFSEFVKQAAEDLRNEYKRLF